MKKPKRSGEIMFFVIWVLIIIMLVLVKMVFFSNRSVTGTLVDRPPTPLVLSFHQTSLSEACLPGNCCLYSKIPNHERDQ
jgi:hypothetical protein